MRQGEPFSPLLFNIAADGLACLIRKVQEMGLIEGLIPHIIERGCAMLQCADDTIIVLQNNLERATNLKFILILFEQMSGLKLDFQKSEGYCFGDAEANKEIYDDIFTCPNIHLPMRNLGVPIDKKILDISQWIYSEEKMGIRLGSKQGRILRLGGRLVLINSCLSNVTLYTFSLYLAPKGVTRKKWTFTGNVFYGKVARQLVNII
jgi:hypothetical protein